MNPAQFDIKRADPRVVRELAQSLGMPHFIATVMATRGISDASQAEKYLHPSLHQDWLNPYIIPGLDEVANGLEQAIRERKHILVFGDFDVDGISATTVLTRGLRALGATVTPFIPHRFDHGYGVSAAALECVSQMDPRPDVIVTVDNGISCGAAVRQAQEMGFKVLVTDHHEPGDDVPQDIPVADPKLDQDCPSTILAGVGVALKMVQALGSRFGHPNLWLEYTDFAALGTVADLMPMTGENRALVKDGIARINNPGSKRPCIEALLLAAKANEKPVTSTSLSFSLIPRLNAAGRMGDSSTALNLLLSDDFDEAFRLAELLESLNMERRSIEAELTEQAEQIAKECFCQQRALVVWHEGWHEGVKGIVASRLASEYRVPCILFTVDGDQARGSGRSVGKINLFRAVESCRDLLTRFGGHDAAVGVTLPVENLPAFNERLCAYMDTLPDSDFSLPMRVDALVSLDELTEENVRKLDALEPFGQENPVPRLMARDVVLNDCRGVGKEKEKKHLSCAMSNGTASVAAIMFHCNDVVGMTKSLSVANVVFEVQIDEYRNRRNVKAMIKQISLPGGCAVLRESVASEDQSFIEELYAADDESLCQKDRPSRTARDAFHEAFESNREGWVRLARENPESLNRNLVHALIGDGQLHPAQRAVLDSLAQGKSVLSVMATGRGKSLVFQLHAAHMALAHGKASLFVYPLRALIADQAYHLHDVLMRFGVTTIVLNGETPLERRERIYQGLNAGEIDIILTTPEFLECHSDRFAESGRIGFVVVDEAHHVAQAQGGGREAYAAMPRILRELGSPKVLACTATASDREAQRIMQILPIDEAISDVTCRPNLRVMDYRGIVNREDYLAHLVAQGRKTIVYVNSREQSVHLARILRSRVPHLAMHIGFYNAGLSRAERTRVEDLFRTGAFIALVATSAFGEGVNISDVRNVVLYNLPFSDIELNQISGRAGRDGQPAIIHLLYNRQDVLVNEGILRDITPDDEQLREMYKQLRGRQRQTPDEPFVMYGDELDNVMRCALTVFSDLRLIEVQRRYLNGRRAYCVRVIPTANRVELSDSVRYREGLGERSLFQDFANWVLGAGADELQHRIAYPIYPNRTDQLFGREDGYER